MRGVAIVVILGLSALAACDDVAVPVDGSVDAHSDSSTADSFVFCDGCNPVAQAGCGPFEKCSINWARVDVPSCGGPIDCFPDTGEGASGEACTVDAETGADDCAAGLLCYQPGEPAPVCREICLSAPDTCSEGTCVVFEPFGLQNIGVCLPP